VREIAGPASIALLLAAPARHGGAGGVWTSIGSCD
jgi:hypothetical protein